MPFFSAIVMAAAVPELNSRKSFSTPLLYKDSIKLRTVNFHQIPSKLERKLKKHFPNRRKRGSRIAYSDNISPIIGRMRIKE